MQEEISTLEELLAYIKRYESSIFVRDKVDGDWGAYSLAEISPESWGEKVGRFIQEGIVPVRVLSDEEVVANQQGDSIDED